MNDISWKKLVDEMPLGFVEFKIIRQNDGTFIDIEFISANYFFTYVFFKNIHPLIGRRLSNLKAEGSYLFDFLQPIILDYVNEEKKDCECQESKSGKYFRARFIEVEQDDIGVFFREISFEKETDSQKKQFTDSLKNFYTFFNSVTDMLFILDNNGNIEYVNKSVFDRLGYSQEELYGHSVLNIHPEHRRQEALLNVQEMLAGERQNCPVPVITKSGVIIPVETRVTDGVWNGQRVLFGVSKDISELKKSEEKFSKAFHNSSAIMAISKASDGTYIDVNEAFCDKLGYTREEVIGKKSTELNLFVNIESRKRIASLNGVAHSKRNIEVDVRSKDGTILTGLFNVDQIYLEDELCLITSMADITDRLKIEKEIIKRNIDLTETVSLNSKEIAEAQLATIIALSNITEKRDTDTGNHNERLKEGCKIIVDRLNNDHYYPSIVNDEFVTNIQYASVLHDIGKVGIRDSILLKPGKYTDEEYEEMKQHPIIGSNVLRKVFQQYHNNKLIEMGIDIALNHHEKWDGSGYPNHLKGDEIPLSAQVLAICDVYDALRSKRSYKNTLSHGESCRIIIENKGIHFNPILVDVFIECEEEFANLYEKLLEGL